MPNLFQKAAAKAGATASDTKGKKKQNIFPVEDPEVAQAIDDFVHAHDEMKRAEADKEVASGVAKPFCRAEFLKQFAEAGRKPETIKFRTPEGNTVTFVVQDRGERYSVSEEQMETIKTLIGRKKTKQIIVEDMTFSFNNVVLSKAGVMNALGDKITELVAEEVLTEDEAANLLVATERTTVRKGVLDDLADLCGNDTDTMEALMDALGSHQSHYIKA